MLGLFLLVVIIVLLLLLTIFHYGSNGRKYWHIRKVPYQEPCPIFGNFGATLTLRSSYCDMLQYLYESYRDEKFVGIFQARRPTLMVRDLELAKSILSKHFSNFGDRTSVATDTRREPLLRNLSNMSGAEWKAMRHIITPPFTSAKLKAMFPLIIECAETLKATLKKIASDDVNVNDLMCRYTTDVIGSCAFGVDPGSLKDPESPFLKMSQKMFKTGKCNMLKRYCRTYFPRIFRFFNFRTYSPDIEAFFTMIMKQVLNDRRSSGIVRHDFLHYLMNVEKDAALEVTDDLITSNSFIFMLAGLETSSATLSFCLYELAKDKDLQEEVRKEIVECLSRNGGVKYEAVAEMKLATQAVLETLRLHPVTPITTRVCTSTCQLEGTNLVMNTKDAIIFPIMSIQKDPKYFPNPDKFDPDRFKDHQLPEGFLAFGDGPRCCPGSRFAQYMLVAGLAAVLSAFSVEPCKRTTPRIEYDSRSVLLKNKGGIWLKFKPL